MLWPLLTMAFATHVYFFASLLARSRAMLLELESGKDWVRGSCSPPRKREASRMSDFFAMGGYAAYVWARMSCSSRSCSPMR